MADSHLDSDVVPDAEPDAANVDNDVQRTAEDHDQREADDELIEKWRIELPLELKHKHNDLVIIFAEDDRDRQCAVQLREQVNKQIFLLDSGKSITARAVLQDEVAEFVTSRVDWLDYALEYNTLICFLFTNKFINDPWQKEMAKASFWQTVCNLSLIHI